MLQTLATIGLGEIILVDGDEVAVHNLHRQPVYRLKDEGQKKALCAKTFWEERTRFTQFKAVAEFLNEQNKDEIFDGVSLIIDGTDSNECTTLLNGVSVRHGIPLIMASVEQGQGYVGVFTGQPCYNCLFPEFPDVVPVCSEAGVDPRAVSLTAALQAGLVLEALLNPGKISGTVLRIQSGSGRVVPLEAQADKNCVVCATVKRKKKDKKMSDKRAIEVVQNTGNGFQLVDVRGPDEFQMQPRDGAVNIPMNRVMSDPSVLPDAPLVLCCASGVRSLAVAEFLRDIGWKNEVQVLDQS